MVSKSGTEGWRQRSTLMDPRYSAQKFLNCIPFFIRATAFIKDPTIISHNNNIDDDDDDAHGDLDFQTTSICLLSKQNHFWMWLEIVVKKILVFFHALKNISLNICMS